MRKTLDNYQARKQDIPTEEKAERDAVIETLRKAWIAFEIKMEQQTENLSNMNYSKALPNLSYQGLNDPSETMVPEASNRHGIRDQYDNLSDNKGIEMTKMVKEDDFDSHIELAVRKLDILERKLLQEDENPDEAIQWHLGEFMTHSYYLDTLS